jgi:hypothetical protein
MKRAFWLSGAILAGLATAPYTGRVAILHMYRNPLTIFRMANEGLSMVGFDDFAGLPRVSEPLNDQLPSGWVHTVVAPSCSWQQGSLGDYGQVVSGAVPGEFCDPLGTSIRCGDWEFSCSGP